jgi:hypothetical protein
MLGRANAVVGEGHIIRRSRGGQVASRKKSEKMFRRPFLCEILRMGRAVAIVVRKGSPPGLSRWKQRLTASRQLPPHRRKAGGSGAAPTRPVRVERMIDG